MINIQGGNRRPSRGSQADEGFQVFVPAKMLLPNLGARIEERRLNLTQRVQARNAFPLGEVAGSASQRPILKAVCTTVGRGKDVIEMETVSTSTLGCVTILAAVIRPPCDRFP
jgi:hypothetical protein